MKYKDCIRMVEWNTGIKLHFYQKLLLKYLIENKKELHIPDRKRSGMMQLPRQR